MQVAKFEIDYPNTGTFDPCDYQENAYLCTLYGLCFMKRVVFLEFYMSTGNTCFLISLLTRFPLILRQEGILLLPEFHHLVALF